MHYKFFNYIILIGTIIEKYKSAMRSLNMYYFQFLVYNFDLNVGVNLEPFKYHDTICIYDESK